MVGRPPLPGTASKITRGGGIASATKSSRRRARPDIPLYKNLTASGAAIVPASVPQSAAALLSVRSVVLLESIPSPRASASARLSVSGALSGQLHLGVAAAAGASAVGAPLSVSDGAAAAMAGAAVGRHSRPGSVTHFATITARDTGAVFVGAKSDSRRSTFDRQAAASLLSGVTLNATPAPAATHVAAGSMDVSRIKSSRRTSN